MAELLITKGAEVDARSAHQAHRAAPQAPPKWPHFHSQTTTTSLQPENPLSANIGKMPVS